MDSDKKELPVVPDGSDASIKLSHVCKVCGSDVTVMYLGIHCCTSCKMFFRRNANLDLDTNRCMFNGNCEITVQTRGTCRYCRLKKSFAVGLEKDLIRSSHPPHDRHSKTKKEVNVTNNPPELPPSLPVVIPTLDLLNNDRSLLNTNQWSLLSNVTHIYDDKFPASTIRATMTLHLAYPSKIQFKMATNHLKQLVGAFFLSAGPFMKTMPEFVSMPIDDQTILVERNIRSMSGFGGILVLREAEICTNSYYHNASVVAYGHERTHQAARIVSEADIDGTLIKLIVPILALSTCSDIIEPDYKPEGDCTTRPGGTRFFSNTLYLLQSQNVYVEMIFKYMVYRYGYNEASLRFAGLIKSSLDQNLMVSGDGDLKLHDQMVQSVTEETERLLTLQDEAIE